MFLAVLNSDTIVSSSADPSGKKGCGTKGTTFRVIVCVAQGARRPTTTSPAERATTQTTMRQVSSNRSVRSWNALIQFFLPLPGRFCSMRRLRWHSSEARRANRWTKRLANTSIPSHKLNRSIKEDNKGHRERQLSPTPGVDRLSHAPLSPTAYGYRSRERSLKHADQRTQLQTIHEHSLTGRQSQASTNVKKSNVPIGRRYGLSNQRYQQKPGPQGALFVVGLRIPPTVAATVWHPAFHKDWNHGAGRQALLPCCFLFGRGESRPLEYSDKSSSSSRAKLRSISSSLELAPKDKHGKLVSN